MSNETKREVFEGLLESYMYSADMVIDEISTDGVADRLNLGNIIASTRDRYAAALPDDMPVIPKRISKIIRILKSIKMDITQALMYIRSELNSYTDWSLLDNNSEIFARAWVLGVWRVEETGEIVKLEEEK